MKFKKLAFIFVALLVLGASLTLSDEGDFSSEFGLEEGELIVSGVGFSEANGIKTFEFVEDNARVEIKGSVFENIKTESESGYPTYLSLDSAGEIVEAQFVSEGGTYTIKGVEFEVPADSKVYYTKDGGFEFSEKDIKIKKLEFTEEPYKIQSLETINIEDKFKLKGTFTVNEKGFTSDFGSFEYNGVLVNEGSFDSFGFGNVLVVKDSSVDLSTYEGSWIKDEGNKLTINSFSQGNKISVDFMEGNPYLDMSLENLEPNQEKISSILVSGDKVEIILEENIALNHIGTDSGETIISNGRNVFKLSKDEFTHIPGNVNTRNFVSIPMSISSEAFESGTLFAYEDNGYIVKSSEGENIITFDKSQFGNPDYVFESAAGEKIHSFAEDKIANSGFIWGGREEKYFIDGLPIAIEIPEIAGEGFDCIGLLLCAIDETYSDVGWRDIPPNLKAVEFLEDKKSWTSYIVEPSGVVGRETTFEKIKSIPAGSAIFLMKTTDSEASIGTEGIDYQKYINSKGEEKILKISHTLIKDTGDTSFINAIPGQEINSRVAREYNEYLISQGEAPLFTGEVRTSELVPKNTYLLVVEPPKD